jgi:hypothetical protein
MSGSESSITFSAFLFGALPRQLLTAVILEGIGVLGYLQVNSRGFVNFELSSTYLLGTAVTGLISVVLTIFYSYRIGRSSYSPVLNRAWTPLLIALGYSLLGIMIASITFFAHFLLLMQLHPPTLEDIGFGISIGCIFGFLILQYLSRFGVETPGNVDDLNAAVSEISKCRQELDESAKAPIRLTSFYVSLEESMELARKCLKESSTNGGRELAQDIEDWTSVFRKKPEVSQAAIVQRSRYSEEQELTELQEDFESIIERLDRISNDE